MGEPLEHQVLGDRYQLSERVGRGGMAQVYLGMDLLLRRQVAVKILDGESAADPVFVERFRREAQAVAQLNHPNIVSIFDWGSVGNTYYMVMEYVPGENLKERLGGGPLPETEALEIAAQTAAALGVAHEHGLIHRDIKPQNILLAPSGVVKVVDFGIAYTAGVTQLTRTNAVAGTAHYLSPEQAQSRPLDSRTDIYSLGVVLFEMLTGREPFQGGTLVEIAMHHVHDRPPNPAGLVPGLSPATAAIVLKALAKSPDERFHDASEMRAALLETRSDILIHSARPGADRTVAAPIEDTAPTESQPARTRELAVQPRSGGRTVPGNDRRWPARLLMAVPVLLLILVGVPALLLTQSPGQGRVAKPTVPAVAQRHATPTAKSVRNVQSVRPTVTSLPAPPNTVPPSLAPTANVPHATSAIPTAHATALPTRAPQIAAVQHPQNNAPFPGGKSSPTQAVYNFYQSISSGNLAGAQSLETANMQSNYPPEENIMRRFADTQQITIQPPTVLSQNGDTAQVSVTGYDQEKPGSPRSNQSFHLIWTLKKRGQGWKLDNVSA